MEKAGERSRRRYERHALLLEFETTLWRRGLNVAGLDEAGAGPLAGPVMAACVVLNPKDLDKLVGVDDSKKLSARTRERLAGVIQSSALAFGMGQASVDEIDRINIRQAGLLAMERALRAVTRTLSRVDHLLIDARRLSVDVPQTELVKGDARSLSIAAASILAKVHRDKWMQGADAKYPSYAFGRNMGYGTAEHLAALETHGPSPIHRRSFEPVRSMTQRCADD